MKKAKIFFWIYTGAQVVYLIFSVVELLLAMNGISDSEAAVYMQIEKSFLVMFSIYVIFYYFYRILFLYKKSSKRWLWSGVMIVLLILIALSFTSIQLPGIVGTIANIVGVIAWLYDIKVLFLTE